MATVQIKISKNCQKDIASLKKNNKLFTKIKKQLLLFNESPRHPSLRLHKLSGIQKEAWSISVDMSYRLLFYYQSNDSKSGQKVAVFFACGKHEEVYK